MAHAKSWLLLDSKNFQELPSAGLDLPHFPKKALATHRGFFPQVVFLAVLNYHRLSQKCIGSGKFDCLSIALFYFDRARFGCWLVSQTRPNQPQRRSLSAWYDIESDPCWGWLIGLACETRCWLQHLYSDFRSVVLIRMLPGALNRLILPMTSLFWRMLHGLNMLSDSFAKLDSLKNN